MGKRLYVGNLPYDTDEGSLRDAFGQDGRVVASVHLVMDRETGRLRGFAFVEMQTDEEAKKAIAALDGQDFRGRMLRINEAEDRRPGGPSGPGRGPSGPPRSGGFSGSRPAGPAGGVGPPRPVGDLGSGPRRPNFGADSLPVEDRRKFGEKKKVNRKHDENPDFGGRRGDRRFDDDDEP
ncbi:MAG: RNA-binding protein [Planctomycetes bacterium]|nr:RNA-binding protein [Planctomycetota bacterium]